MALPCPCTPGFGWQHWKGATLYCSHRPSLPKFHPNTQHWEVKWDETQAQSLNKITLLAIIFPEPQLWNLTKLIVKWRGKNNASIWQLKSACNRAELTAGRSSGRPKAPGSPVSFSPWRGKLDFHFQLGTLQNAAIFTPAPFTPHKSSGGQYKLCVCFPKWSMPIQLVCEGFAFSGLTISTELLIQRCTP